MKTTKRIAAVLVLGLAGLVGGAFLLPAEYRVERSVVIDAPSDRVHALVGDLDRWPDWTPWQDEDPSIVVSRGPTASGVGATQSWTGDSGNGSLTFTATTPARGIEYDLEFDDGAWRGKAGLAYEPGGGSTRVVWWMAGDAGANPIGRYFGAFMDGMVGPMFESGLEKLKARVEHES